MSSLPMSRRLGDLCHEGGGGRFQHLYDIGRHHHGVGRVVELSTRGRLHAPLPRHLVNGGQGRNYGVELTLARAFRDGWFVLLTGSVFDAYTGADGIYRNTDFNGR